MGTFGVSSCALVLGDAAQGSAPPSPIPPAAADGATTGTAGARSKATVLAEFPGWAAQVGSPSLSHVPGTPSGDAQQELTLPLLSPLAPTGGRESGKRTRRCHPNTCRSLGTDATTSPGTALLGKDGMCSPPRQNEVMAGGDRGQGCCASRVLLPAGCPVFPVYWWFWEGNNK